MSQTEEEQDRYNQLSRLSEGENKTARSAKVSSDLELSYCKVVKKSQSNLVKESYGRVLK